MVRCSNHLLAFLLYASRNNGCLCDNAAVQQADGVPLVWQRCLRRCYGDDAVSPGATALFCCGLLTPPTKKKKKKKKKKCFRIVTAANIGYGVEGSNPIVLYLSSDLVVETLSEIMTIMKTVSYLLVRGNVVR